MNERLRKALAAAHLTREDLAQATGVDPKTVQHWINGRIPHARHRWKTAELLKVHEDVLWPVENESVSSKAENTDLDAVRRLLVTGALGLAANTVLPGQMPLVMAQPTLIHFTYAEKHLLIAETELLSRVDLLYYQAEASAMLGMLETSCTHIQTAVTLAKSAGSRLYYNKTSAPGKGKWIHANTVNPCR